MAFEVHCGKCSARFTLPDDLYERKVRGRVVTVRCKKCRADISVDGTKDSRAAKGEPDDAPSPASLPAVEGLWVVSFGDDDDRELTIGQLKKAFEKGEINRETLVWNTTLDEWLMIAEVPALADLVATDEVGGFLGTGVSIGAEANALLGEDEIGPFRSAGAGTMSEREANLASAAESTQAKPDGKVEATRAAAKADEDAEKKEPPVLEGTPTVPLARPPARASKSQTPELTESGAGQPSKPPPKPGRKLPNAPAKMRPSWMGDAPKAPATEDPDLPEGEEASPSSGTPALRTLMGSLKPPADPVPDQGESVSEDIFAIGGGGIAAGLPTIDLTSIEPPPPSSDPKSSRRKRDEDAPDSGGRPRPKSKRSESLSPKGKRPPPAPSGRDEKSAKARTAPAEEEKSGSSIMWILLAAVAAVAVYWFFLRNPDGAGSTEPTARPTTETRTEVTPPEPTLAKPPLTAETAAPAADAAPIAPEDAAVTKKEEKPVEKTEKKEELTSKEEKPVKEEKKEEKPPTPEGTGGEVAMAAPFDANAARAALSSAAGAAASCHQEGDPAGAATVVVTFAPSGRVTSANISGPPFAGTKTGGCIAAAMRRAKVPAFSGEHVTVSKTVSLQ